MKETKSNMIQSSQFIGNSASNCHRSDDGSSNDPRHNPNGLRINLFKIQNREIKIKRKPNKT